MAGQKPTDYDVALGIRLQAARKASGLTQAAVAAAVGFSPAQWQKYERGHNSLGARQLMQAAIAMSADPALLLTGGETFENAMRPPAPLDAAIAAASKLAAFLSGLKQPA